MIATASPSSVFRFGRFELQPAERQLLGAGAPVAIGPRAFDVLVVLVERAGSLVTKDELFARVWPGVIVEENSLQAQVSLLRKILGPEAIATVAGSGYRLAMAVTASRDSSHQPPLPEDKGPPPNNLPQELTSFIGRENEIGEIERLLAKGRLLTVTGTGGCGKTRLALRVATNIAASYVDGVWLVELASLTDPSLVARALADVLGVADRANEGLAERLGNYLSGRRVLVIIDNAEHLLDACAQLAERLLRRCPLVSVLVTSRERLAVDGELAYRIPSLTVPDPMARNTPEGLLQSESVRLFVERAQLQQPRFKASAQNAQALASICWRLDGIPLAIELAAPRLRSMTVEELERGLDGRFGLLTGGSRTALPRQRTLRSLIDWSYDLLSIAEQAMLCLTSVFVGGWTLAAVEAVCVETGGDPMDVRELLTSLVDKSLVIVETFAGKTRYSLLQTVREYAADRLQGRGDAALWRKRHAEYFLRMAEESEEALRGSEQASWLEQLVVEHDNLRAALTWGLTADAGDRGLALRIAGALFPFWHRRSIEDEALRWLVRCLQGPSDEQSRAARAKALNAAGHLSTVRRNFDAARAFLDECIAIRRELSDRRGVAVSLLNLGSLVSERSNPDFDQAALLFEEALIIRRELSDRWGVANALASLANVLMLSADGVNNRFERPVGRESYERARLLAEESLVMRRDLRDLWGIAFCLHVLGEIALRQRDALAAASHLNECLGMIAHSAERHLTVDLLCGCAELAFMKGLLVRAAILWGAAEQRRLEAGRILPPSGERDQSRLASALHAALGDDPAFARSVEKGREMTREESLRFAMDDIAL